MSLFERSEKCKSRGKLDEIGGDLRLRSHSGEIIQESEVTSPNDERLRSHSAEIIGEIIHENAEQGLEDRNLSPQVDPVNYAWLEVGAAAGMTDLTTDNLDHALFLFARNLVTSCPDAQFMDMGHRYCPSWRIRLPSEAWAIVEEHIRARLNRLGWKKGDQ